MEAAGGENRSGMPQRSMDIHAAMEEVARWCVQQTTAGDAEAVEVDCDASVWITIGESAPPWHVRVARRCSSGASGPVAQLRYDLETRDWALHHGDPAPAGWCSDEDAVHARELGPLLDEIAGDRSGRFEGLGAGFRWPWV
jgi:hypothetical protein